MASTEAYAPQSAPNSVGNGSTAITALSPVSSGYSSSHTSSPTPATSAPVQNGSTSRTGIGNVEAAVLRRSSTSDGPTAFELRKSLQVIL